MINLGFVELSKMTNERLTGVQLLENGEKCQSPFHICQLDTWPSFVSTTKDQIQLWKTLDFWDGYRSESKREDENECGMWKFLRLF